MVDADADELEDAALERTPVVETIDLRATDASADRDRFVAGLVDGFPFGVAVRDEITGILVYANDASAALEGLIQNQGEDDPRHLETTEQIVTADGRRFAVATTRDVTESRRRENALTRRAFFDELTGLPKTHLMRQTVDDMIGQGTQAFALSFIDVDNFKFINDYYGHTVGDQLLVKIARRIAEATRSTDLMARVGGDEFVLLTTPLESLDVVGPEVERLSTRFREPFYIDGFEIFASASIGVSLYPIHGETYEVLRANADSAMYRVKESTKGGVQLFDVKLSESATARMEVEQRLRLAIRDKSFCCAFQPKVDFRADTIVGLEVLLRWRDENGVIRAPGDFIKLAIELGLMDDISMIVLDQVIDQIDLINDAFGPRATISLNVAAKQAGDLVYMERLADCLAATGYAERFILELTEEAFLAKGSFQNNVLPMMKALGIGISIDDFGVGYSSLSALAEITADELKIDRSFITDIHKKPRNQTILKVIELLGEALGMKIIVEGIETFEELVYIQTATRISCAQGYYFSKPMFLQEPFSKAAALAPARAARRSGGHLRSTSTNRY